MPIRFKFRSSLNFDTLETGDRGSISVRELRAKILHGKVAQQRQQGFDLIFTDEASGLEYEGDESQIPSGSNVIVRRVPAEIRPKSVSSVQAAKDIVMKASNNQKAYIEPMNQFHFGSDLLPSPDLNFPDLSSDFDKDNFMDSKKKDVAGLRDLDSSGISRLESEKLNSCELTQAVVGFNQPGNESTVQAVDDQMKLNKFSTSTFVAKQSTNLPLEFKCLLCNNFFKEAVMIPCCQHSFCEICIRKVLIEKNKCPKCYSSKCNVKDLLPNLSLRQATEHFLESQMLDTSLGNDMQTYVADGESHIQAKDVSSALALQPQKVSQKDGWEDSYRRHSIKKETQEFTTPPDFQGENQPVIPLANHDEAHSHTSRNRVYNSGGGDRNFVGGGPRKGVRTCYTCGAPDHLMRDCPVANPNPMFQPGNGMFHGGIPPYAAPPYWNGPSLPPFRPYPNIYGNPAMMAFNASMATPTSFAVPPYMGPMHGGLPGSAMRVGNMGPPHHPDHFGLQHCENKRKHSDEDTGSEQLSENRNDSRNSSKKPHDYKLKKDKEASSSHSGDSLAQRSGRKSWNDQHSHSDVDERHDRGSRSSAAGTGKRSSNSEWLNSGKHDLPRNFERQDDAKHTHSHHHGVSKKYHDKRGHYDSDSTMGHELTQKDVKRRYEHDDGGSHKKHHGSSETGFVHRSSSHRRVEYKERDSRYDDKHLREKQRDDRQKPVHGWDEDIRGEYQVHKRRAY